MAEQTPPQLLMIILGEGGVGKSKTIQTITEDFEHRRVGHLLAKGAYTGIAASVIDGKTLHVLAGFPLNGHQQSAQVLRRLTAFWAPKRYLIIDEMSMVSREFLARLSSVIGAAKTVTGNDPNSDRPFGGLNVILVGDFHQFPPVVSRKSAPLFWPCNVLKDTVNEMIGRKVYEQFGTVVRLKEQVRVTDPVWNDLLQHVRYGKCRERHLQVLRELIITNTNCPPTDFARRPWSDVVLITPRHAVRTRWNTAAVVKKCAADSTRLFIVEARDMRGGRLLSLPERYVVATTATARERNRGERGGLPNVVELAIGMRVMVTVNVNTDLDVANGARGEVMHIVLDDREEVKDLRAPTIKLQFPPCYVLVKLTRTKATKLESLPEHVIPVVPITRVFTIQINGQKLKITRSQLPMTPTYAFTDYRSQGQTITPVLIDIGPPPSGGLTPFNAYVALSRGRSRENIRLLRDFDDKIFTNHPSEFLRMEDMRLEALDAQTTRWWNEFRAKGAMDR